MTHPNETMLSNAYTAFATGDLATVTAMFSDDIAWHASGTNPARRTAVIRDSIAISARGPGRGGIHRTGRHCATSAVSVRPSGASMTRRAWASPRVGP